MPPVETLGSHFYIPPLTGFNFTGAKIIMIATEDSTVNIVRGTDYDQVETFYFTGNITSRKLSEEVVSHPF